jgi:predicted RNA binding protein YcfA (HicA-like mRNA interferase family)
LATFGDLKRYLERDGWQPVQNRARGRVRGGDHVRYEKPQPSGRPLRTKVSRHPNEEIGPDLFRQILREQLRVDEPTFWGVVRGTASITASEAPPISPGMPAWLVLLLLTKVGLSEDEVEKMSIDEAERAWVEYQTRSS